MKKRNSKHDGLIRQLVAFYDDKALTMFDEHKQVPALDEVMRLLDDLHRLLYPAYYQRSLDQRLTAYDYVETILKRLEQRLDEQIRLALLFCKQADCDQDQVQLIIEQFIQAIPQIQALLLKDAQMIYDGDPAATNLEEIIVSYPGFYAIFVYRFAHVLYNLKVPIIPRMMTETAHSKTGIDINPGAVIGEYFFIDHGTGIVIGETAVIGSRVKLYQGVTLGALSTQKGQLLAGIKRHPTVGDNVTIYSNATILGGETVIGANVIIGGNAFITESVKADTKVSLRKPELVYKDHQPK